MKIKEYLAVLFDVAHGDNDVSAFYILNESLEALRKCKQAKKKELASCVEEILKYVSSIEKSLNGNGDVHRLDGYRTISEYIDAVSAVDECMHIESDIEELREKVKRFDELIMDLGDINANGDEIAKWMKTVPDAAYHPVSQW